MLTSFIKDYSILTSAWLMKALALWSYLIWRWCKAKLCIFSTPTISHLPLLLQHILLLIHLRSGLLTPTSFPTSRVHYYHNPHKQIKLSSTFIHPIELTNAIFDNVSSSNLNLFYILLQDFCTPLLVAGCASKVIRDCGKDLSILHLIKEPH